LGSKTQRGLMAVHRDDYFLGTLTARR
jgi:hypothetical protein